MFSITPLVVSVAPTGAVTETSGGRHKVRARNTLIATGGFEWDEAMMTAHFGNPRQFIGPPAGNTGDGQRLAAAAGAAMGCMDQATITAAIPRRYHGRVHGMPVPYHAEENAIVVNRLGQRFEDELHMNLGAALDRRDPETGVLPNQPAFMITDAGCLRQAPLVRFLARLVPGWMRQAPTLEALAAEAGIDPAGLVATVARYDHFAATGVDEDFGRGKARAHQQADKRKRAGMRPIARPSFTATRVFMAAGVFGPPDKQAGKFVLTGLAATHGSFGTIRSSGAFPKAHSLSGLRR